MFIMFDDIHPLLTTTKNSIQYAKLVKEKVGPFFYVTHYITKGVVGLGISSEGIAVKFLPHQRFMVFLHVVSSLLQSIMEVFVFDRIPNEEEMQSIC
jgi:hypothetical protein